MLTKILGWVLNGTLNGYYKGQRHYREFSSEFAAFAILTMMDVLMRKLHSGKFHSKVQLLSWNKNVS